MARIVLLILTTFAMCSALVFAQGSTGRRHQDPNYLVVRTVSETILSVRLTSSELVMRDFDGNTHNVKIDSQTKFPDARAKALAELRDGQRITLTYRVVDSLALEIRPVTLQK